MERTLIAMSGLGLLALAAARTAEAQSKPIAYPKMAPLEQYLIADRRAEIALARSAAPASISADATVMVLTPHGYEPVAEGKNGFICLVDRSWQAGFEDPDFWNPKLRGPVCLNPRAVRSVLPMQMRLTELALAGVPLPEIRARMKAAVDKKEFGPPEPGAMSYMMSKDQYLSDGSPHWHPHLMMYLPSNVESAEWGANLPHSPALGGPQDLPASARLPVTIFFVPVGEWSDGTPAPLHERN